MTTTNSRHRWIALVAVPAFAIAACDDNRPADAVLGSPVAAAATDRAVQALEADPGFAGEVTGPGDLRPVCTSRPMGISPDVATAEQVETVYAWIYCKWIPRSGDTAPANLAGLVSPVVVYPGDDLLYALPQVGEERRQSILDMFPANLGSTAVGRSPEESAAVRELDARVARELSR